MFRQIGSLTAILVLLTAGNVRATIIELPLDCAGTYSFNDLWAINFDLGVEFTDIAHVYIDWEGEITAGLAIRYDNPEVTFPMNVGLTAVIERPFPWRHTTIWKGESTYPDSEPFDVRSEFIYGTMPWSELYDGKAELRIGYIQVLMMNGEYIEPGLISLNNANLVIDGTMIPEPVTITLLSMGLVGIRLRRKKQ